MKITDNKSKNQRKMETTDKIAKDTTSDMKRIGTVILNIDISRNIIGLSELGNLEITDFGMNMEIIETIAELSKIEKVYLKTLNALMKRHIDVDEKGNFKNENGMYVFKTPNDKKTYLEEYEKLTEHENDIDFKIKASVLKGIVGLKASTMSKFHEFIENDLKK